MANSVGKIGEDIATKLLINKGFKILDRNYSKKFGEIDIIALKDKEIYFVEVKTLSVSFKNLEGTESQEMPRPEEKVDRYKLARISRAVRTYISEKRLDNFSWHFLVISVLFDQTEKTARVRIIEDVIPE